MLKRHLAILVAADPPLPFYEKKGEKYVEVDPPATHLPPSAVTFVEKRFLPTPLLRKDPSGRFSTRSMRLVEVFNYKGVQNLKLSLNNPLLPGRPAHEVSCDLGKRLHPFILIHADMAQKGWEAPITEVLDIAPRVFPAGSLMVVNLTPHAVRLTLPGHRKALPGGGKALVKGVRKDGSLRYKLEIENGKGGITTLCNSRYTYPEESRLLLVIMPPPRAAAGAPVKQWIRPSVRFVTLPVQPSLGQGR